MKWNVEWVERHSYWMEVDADDEDEAIEKAMDKQNQGEGERAQYLEVEDDTWNAYVNETTEKETIS